MKILNELSLLTEIQSTEKKELQAIKRNQEKLENSLAEMKLG